MIRDARADDCATLSELAFISKAHWGYDDGFMEACRDELTVRPGDLDRVRVRVATQRDDILGFHGVEHDEMVWLFVAPDAMKRGVGAALFADACAVARQNGADALRIEADPYAAPFYERMGARWIGEAPSAALPGRVLPVYSIDVSSTRG